MRENALPPLVRRLLEANARYVAGEPQIPRDAVPKARLAVVTCMDVRIDPLPLLGLRLGEAHVLRNAGARITDDVLRSLVISQQALGTNAVVVLPHTLCGVLGLDVTGLKPHPGTPRQAVPTLDFHPMEDLEAALAQDLRLLRESPWILPGVEIHGFILDIDTGALLPRSA